MIAASELNNIYESAGNEGLVEGLKAMLDSLRRKYKIT